MSFFTLIPTVFNERAIDLSVKELNKKAIEMEDMLTNEHKKLDKLQDQLHDFYKYILQREKEEH